MDASDASVEVSSPARRRVGVRLPFVRVAGRLLPAAMVLLAASAAPALAHGDTEVDAATIWTTWPLSWDIVIPTAIVALVYINGMVRRAGITEPVSWSRHLMFFAGLASVFMALQSPIDPIAEHLFFAHQIQHLLLIMIAPMFIALSAPQGILIAGTPSVVQRTMLKPVLANGVVRRVFGTTRSPLVTTVILVGTLLFWDIPRFHDRALLDEGLHYLMHATMLIAGLIFWWRVFDPRPAPQGMRYGVRLMMVWVVVLANIIVGAYITLKTAVLYGAYDVVGRLFDFEPLADEQIGGFIIWIPSSMMCLIGILVVTHMWGQHETRMDERRTAAIPPDSAAAAELTSASLMLERQRPKNRALAVGFSIFIVAVFTTAILVGVLSNMAGPTHGATYLGADPVQHAGHGEAPSVLR
jgi:putative membrane protein